MNLKKKVERFDTFSFTMYTEYDIIDLTNQIGESIVTFQEFLELNSDQKYITLDDFYRDHLYLRTLAKRLYGDNEYILSTCIFTKDGDFLRSRPTDDDAFKSNCPTVVFDKDISVIFFDSEEAVSIYKRMTETLESPHYHLSKAEIIEMIEEDLDSQIDGVKKVIDDYNTQIRLHQNRVDYLDQMKLNLRKSATLEDQVSLIEDLLDAANMKLIDTKFKFVVNEVISKDLILDHEGGDVYDIHFIFDDKKTVLSKRSSDREKINEWMKDVLDRLDFYTFIVDRFESKLVDVNKHEIHVCLHINDDLIAKIIYVKTRNKIIVFVERSLGSSTIVINDYVTVQFYSVEEARFTYEREVEFSELEEVFQDIDDSYIDHIVR